MVGSKDMKPSETAFFPRGFFQNQFRASSTPPPGSSILSGQVAIITGGNDGLGLEAGHQLLSLKLSRLILAVRSEEKGKSAALALRTRFPSATVDVWLLDMASYASITAFAERADESLDRLNMAILNAGVRKLSFDKNVSTGHEEAIQINYLSTALLTVLMTQILKSHKLVDKPGRLTIVGASLALPPKFPNKDEDPLLSSFDDPESFDPIDRYNTSKVQMHMVLWNLVDYVSARDVIINVVDPGLVKGTNLTREAKGVRRVGAAVFGNIFGRNKTEGASTYIGAIVNKGEESHGGFIMGWQIHPFASFLYSSQGNLVRERLWEETLSGLGFAGIRGFLEVLKEDKPCA